MRESVGHAAANQQNYLDLGYSERVVETQAAWIAGSELSFMTPEGFVPSVGKGIMQAASLANKWGFFGHNGVEEASEFTYRFKPGEDLIHFDKH